eukprot:854689-Pelagomonas_calceolata.AAC.2
MRARVGVTGIKETRVPEKSGQGWGHGHYAWFWEKCCTCGSGLRQKHSMHEKGVQTMFVSNSVNRACEFSKQQLRFSALVCLAHALDDLERKNTCSMRSAALLAKRRGDEQQKPQESRGLGTFAAVC